MEKKSAAIALKIKRTLRLKGISESDLAEMMGVAAIDLERYLSGEENFDLKVITEVERRLGVALIATNVIDRKEVKPLQLQITYQIAMPIKTESNLEIEGDPSFVVLDEKGDAIENLVRYA